MTSGQRIGLARAFGCARVVFNDGLRVRQQAREQGVPYVSDAELATRVITRAKGTPERVWLGEVSAVVLQQASFVVQVTDGQVLPAHPEVLRLRPDQRDDGADRPIMGMPVRQPPRPGRQRRHQRQGRWTGGP